MINDDEDPTIVSNIMDEFRATAYRSSMLPNYVPRDKTSSVLSKARRLKFDECVGSRTSENPDKKLKLTTPVTNVSDGSSNVMSPWEIRRLKSEAIKFKSQVIEAEERINKLEGLKLETELHYSREKKIMEDSLKQERARVAELENRIAFIRKRESEAIERYTQFKFSENNKESNHRHMNLDLQKENQNLKEQVYELQGAIENHRKKEKDEINSYKSELTLMKNKEEMNEQLIETLRTELSEKNNELRKLEVEQTKLLSATKRVKDLEMELETYKETRTYVDLQNKKLLHYSELEKEVTELKEENKRLKSSMSNTLYLEEVVEDLKTRQKALPSLEQEIFKLRTENQNNRIELENWANLAKHYCPDSENVKPSILLKRRLEELVRKELSFVSENKNLEIMVGHLREKVAEKDDEIVKMKEQIETLKTSCEAHAANIRRFKKQLTLVSWERNDLRKLVDSCQKDMTITPEINNQFEALQKLIDGYKERTAQLENDVCLAFPGASSKQSSSEIEELQKRETLLKEENKKLLEKVQNLSDRLEYSHLKGDFDPRQTKIIHLRSNPAAEAIQNHEDRLTKANEEICKLRERIKVMEEGNNADVTRIVEERVQTNSLKEINDLKELAKSLEIQKQRLCEAFKKKSHDFRDAMYMLFGYKINVLANNQYRLCNQYAFDSEDTLLFQISDDGNGTMELLETSFSETLTELINLHLKRHKSIPLFLASLTVDLFNKQTLTSFSTTEATMCDY